MNQIRVRHSLLPPLFMDVFNCSPQNFSSLNSDITPSNVVVPAVKKGKPRKLATEFVEGKLIDVLNNSRF